MKPRLSLLLPKLDWKMLPLKLLALALEAVASCCDRLKLKPPLLLLLATIVGGGVVDFCLGEMGAEKSGTLKRLSLMVLLLEDGTTAVVARTDAAGGFGSSSSSLLLPLGN